MLAQLIPQSTGVLLAIAPLIAAAQTATELDCVKWVETADLAPGSVQW